MTQAPETYISIREASALLGIRPRTLSDAVYAGQLDPDWTPRIAGRHVLRADKLQQIADRLRALGKLPSKP